MTPQNLKLIQCVCLLCTNVDDLCVPSDHLGLGWTERIHAPWIKVFRGAGRTFPKVKILVLRLL